MHTRHSWPRWTRTCSLSRGSPGVALETHHPNDVSRTRVRDGTKERPSCDVSAKIKVSKQNMALRDREASKRPYVDRTPTTRSRSRRAKTFLKQQMSSEQSLQQLASPESQQRSRTIREETVTVTKWTRDQKPLYKQVPMTEDQTFSQQLRSSRKTMLTYKGS